MGFRVEEAISFEDDEGLKGKFTGFLAVVDDYHTVRLERLRELASLTPRIAVSLTPLNLRFDRGAAKWFFAATREWVETPIPVEELRRTMPPKTVSRKAERVAVWKPILRAFNRIIIKVTKTGNLLLAAVPGSADTYLVTFNLNRKLYACSCPAYAQPRDVTWLRRHILCKHLMLGIYHFHEEFLEMAGKNRADWIRSLKACQQHRESQVMLGNWLYYLISKVFSELGFQAAKYVDRGEVERAIQTLTFPASF